MHGRTCVQMAHGVSQGTAVLITPAPPTAAAATATSYSIVIPSSATTLPIAAARPITTTSFVAGPTPLSHLLRNSSTPASVVARDLANSINVPSFGAVDRRPSYQMRRASNTMEDSNAQLGGIATLDRGYTIESPLASALSSIGTGSASNNTVSDSGIARGEAVDAPLAALGRASMSPQPEEPASTAGNPHSPGSPGASVGSRSRASERRGNQQHRRNFPDDLARAPPTRHAALVATRRISEAIATGGMAHFATSGSSGGSSVGCNRNNGRRRHTTRSSTSSAAASRAAGAEAAESADIVTPPRRRQRATRAKVDSNNDRKPASSGKKRAASSSAKSGPATKKAASSAKSAASPASPPAQENKKSDHSCCICLDVPELVELSSINGCAHYFCFGCIEKWADRENTCPLCKNRFTKIDRVHKQPAKRKRKGEASGGPRAKNTKKVKNRDQRADLNQGNPLQGLFASIDGNGQVNQSIAQLIFSGLNVGGITGSLMLSTSNSSGSDSAPAARSSQRSQGQGGRWGASGSASSVGRWGSSSSSSSSRGSSSAADPFPVHPVPVPMGFMRRLAAGNRPDGGPGVDATGAGRSVSFGSSAPRSETSWGFSSGRSHNGPTPSVQVRFGAPSRAWGQQYSTVSAAAADILNEHHDVDINDSDDDFGSDNIGYAQRIRNLDRERQAVIERYHYGTTGGSTGASTAPSQPPTASRTAPVGLVGSGRGRVLNPLGGETADTALLIDDSDDDDDIVEVVSSFGGSF